MHSNCIHSAEEKCMIGRQKAFNFYVFTSNGLSRSQTNQIYQGKPSLATISVNYYLDNVYLDYPQYL